MRGAERARGGHAGKKPYKNGRMKDRRSPAARAGMRRRNTALAQSVFACRRRIVFTNSRALDEQLTEAMGPVSVKTK
jgi:hypothetical protein